MQLLTPSASLILTRSYTKLPPVAASIRKELSQVGPHRVLSPNEILPRIAGNYLVHVGPLPTKGILYARVRYYAQQDSDLARIATQAFGITRVTNHFALNSMACAHPQNTQIANEEVITLIPVESIGTEISGGYYEDIFTIGSRQVPEKSTVLVPEAYKKTKAEELANLPKHIEVQYQRSDETKQQALERVLKVHGQEVFSPVIPSNAQFQDLCMVFQTNSTKKVMLSEDWMGVLKGPPCAAHEVTPLAQIESMFMKDPVFSEAPFLSCLITLGEAQTQNLIGEYISVAKDLFPLSKRQLSILNEYEHAMREITKIFAHSHSVASLRENWGEHGAKILQYDNNYLYGQKCQ